MADLGKGKGARGHDPRSRRRTLGAILAFALAAPAFAQPAGRASGPGRRGADRPRDPALPLAADLAADGREAARGRLPILLFFDRLDCPYCERALREYVVPMSREAPFAGAVLFRRVEIDARAPLTDFDGRPTTHAAFAAKRGISLSPTVLVVDATGRATGEALVGLATPDFYGAYLERAVETGIAAARAAPSAGR